MFNLEVVRGTADVSVPIYVMDSGDGTPETGWAFNTAGIDLWYRREGGAIVSITEATQTATGAHSDGGVVHLANGRGRLDLPDAACALGTDGATYVEYGGTITGMIVVGGVAQLKSETALTGQFSGTHTTTSADLGANAPANSIIGMTLYFPADKQSRIVETYNTGTGVAGWTTAIASAPVNDEAWELFPTAPIDAVTLAAINAEADTAISDASLATSAALTTVGGNVSTVLGRVVGTIASGTHSPQSGDAFSRIGATGSGLTSLASATALQVVDDIVDAILLDTGTDGVVLTAAERVAIADALLGRNIAGGSSTGRTVTSALRRIRNRVAIAAGTMTVYQEDDATSDHTAAVTTSAGDPISEIDPA